MKLLSAGTLDPGRLTKLLAYYGAFVGLGLVLASLGPTLPGLADAIGASLSSLSTIFVARSTGYLAGALVGGRGFDRIPGHPLMALMLTGMAVCMALVPLCSSLISLCLVFAVLGALEGVLDVGGNVLLAWLFPTGLGPWMNGLHLFFGIGALLAPLIVGAVLAEGGSIAYAYWILSALLIPAILSIVVQPSPPIATHARQAGRNTGEHRVTIVLIAGLLFAAVGAEVGFGDWIFTYALRQGLADEAGAAVLTSAFWGAFTFGRLLGIPLAARLRPASILLVCLVACACGSAIPLWSPDLSEALRVGTIIAGLTVAPMFATILALAGEHMPITGKATGWLFVGSSTGGMSIPWIVGQLFESSGPTAAFHVILADLGVGLAIFAVFWFHRGRASLPGA